MNTATDNALSDEQLALKAANGDDRAFEDLFHRYKTRAFSTLLRIVGNLSDAQDLLQEVFLKVYQRLADYRQGSFASWIYRIAFNTALDHLRRTKRLNEQSLDSFADDRVIPNEPAATCPTPEDETIRNEIFAVRDRDVDGGVKSRSPNLAYRKRTDTLCECLSELSEVERTVIILQHVEEMSQIEIAEVLGTGVESAKVIIYRARRHLIRLLTERGL